MRYHFQGKKQVAWEATRNTFIRRICGGDLSPDIPNTDFPSHGVAMAAPLPRNHDHASQVAAFDQLRKMFEEAWSET